MTPKSVFEDFLRDIEPSPTTKANASSAHTTLREFLSKHEEFREVHKTTFLSGSYKRATVIRPKAPEGEVERPDVDIIVVTSYSLSDSPAAVLELLYGTLKDGYSTVRKQQRSVRVETNNAVMDVVPMIAPYGDDGPFYIPDRKLEQWVETNPPRNTQWTTDMNNAAGGRFKPLVKLMKWWRRENPTVSKKPKGFVIECVTAECMDKSEKHYGELFAKTLEGVACRYAVWVQLQVVPHIEDPGVPGNSVTEGMTFAAFEGFYRKAETHAKKARKALKEDDPEKATELWHEIFGERFPTMHSTKASGLLAAAAVPRTATFPARPVLPNKPSGFA
ncbi:MAG: nucleotidyltransferase [Candidatus Binatia bacterium]